MSNQNCDLSGSSILLKSLALFAFSLLFLACPPKPSDLPTVGDCTSVRVFDSSYTKTFPYAHECNEIILDAGHPNKEQYKVYLQSNGFELKEICPCGSGFELWARPINIGGVDIGTIVQQGPKTGGIGGGIFPNVLMGFPEPVIPTGPKNIDSATAPGICTFTDTVDLAIVDTGVDTLGESSNKLRHYHWMPYHSMPRCAANPNIYGLHLNPNFGYSEPRDHHGHGSSVNAVATGAARPGLSNQVPIQFINIGITQDDTKVGRLFDALCGLHYALEQQPDIINISWGFKYIVDSSNQAIDSSLSRVFDNFFLSAAAADVLVVAGSGNDSMNLSADHKFYPAWLANQHVNGVSVGSMKVGQPLPSRSPFSNYCDSSRKYLSFLAPGESILCAYPEYKQIEAGMSSENVSGTAYQSGTSFAAPYVSRLAAMFLSKNPNLSAAELKLQLLSVTKIITESPDITQPKVRMRYLDPGMIQSTLCPIPGRPSR